MTGIMMPDSEVTLMTMATELLPVEMSAALSLIYKGKGGERTVSLRHPGFRIVTVRSPDAVFHISAPIIVQALAWAYSCLRYRNYANRDPNLFQSIFFPGTFRPPKHTSIKGMVITPLLFTLKYERLFHIPNSTFEKWKEVGDAWSLS